MTKIKNLDKNDVIRGSIDRISNSGNGIIELENGFINIGPVKQETVGKMIKAVIITKNYAFCLTDSVRKEGYVDEIDRIANRPDGRDYDHEIPPEPIVTTNQQNYEYNGNSEFIDVGDSERPDNRIEFTGGVKFCDACGTMMSKRDHRWVCESCDFEKEIDRSASKSDLGLKNNSDVIRNTKNDSIEPDSPNSTQDSDNNKPDSKQRTELNELKKRAESEAVEKVSNDATTGTTTKPEYTRSQAVIDYVKRRADGICEGCEQQAPFTSKTGDPYLHAHHVHELSEGGSDTPDTVIALCPNCHYRVHHGRDGDEYNSKLIEKLDEIE